MKTGDANLDDPAARQRMEDSYNNAPFDSDGYRLEAGGVCYLDGQCVPGTGATRERVDIAIDGTRRVRFDWHTHGNVGRPRMSGIPGDMYTSGPSGPDISDAEMVYGNDVLRMLRNNAFPSYIIEGAAIYRLTPGANGAAVVTKYDRWASP